HTVRSRLGGARPARPARRRGRGGWPPPGGPPAAVSRTGYPRTRDVTGTAITAHRQEAAAHVAGEPVCRKPPETQDTSSQPRRSKAPCELKKKPPGVTSAVRAPRT